MSYSTDVQQRYQDIKRSKRITWALGVGGVIGILILLWIALGRIGLVPSEIWAYRAEFGNALRNYFPLTTVFGIIPFLDVWQYWAFIMGADPDTVVLAGQTIPIPELFQSAGITLAIGFAGTVLGFPLALLFGVLGSERVVPFPFNFIFRGTMSCIRAIPALVWVLIYVPLGGVTPITATLAVATDTIGNLGRLFTDELEEIEDGPIEAIETTGANKPQTVTFGMLSQVFTPFIAWTLYIFEINVRIAVGLGIIGAGGLGWVLDNQRRLFNYTEMMATIIVILVLIICVEMFSQRVRSHIRADDEPMEFTELVFGAPRRIIESWAK
jgi:phosphonate transport system permease protein